MRRSIIAAGVVAGTLGLALATPALAAGGGPGPGNGTGSTAAVCNGTGGSDGAGARAGAGQQGREGQQHRQVRQGQRRMSRGAGSVATDATLTDAQAATLRSMAEEEKVAGDLYAVLGERYDDAELLTIAASEDRHLDRVRVLMTRYQVADPTQGMGVGEFASTQFQQMYDDLVAQGSGSLAAAYDVGVAVEKADIEDLEAAIAEATTRDVTRVYTNLLAASQHHLAAFSG